MIHRKRCCIEALEPRRLLAVGVLADINTDSPSYGLAPIATIGSRMICVSARAGSTGDGLWATDGTAGKTVRLTAERAADPTLSNGRVFFVLGGTTLWSTDGTTAGTREEGALPGATTAGLDGSSADVPFSLIDVNGIVYIGGKDGLWRSDGTAAGTVRLVVGDGVPFAGVEQLTQRNSDVFFVVTTADHAKSIWRTDGTAAGTFMLRGLDPTSGFVRHGRNLYFLTADAMWRTNGTRKGTVVVRTFAPGELNIFTNELGSGGGRLFFNTFHISYPDPVYAPERSTRSTYFWSSDGSAEGTQVITDFGDRSSPPNGIGRFLPVGAGVVFAMTTHSESGFPESSDLWRSDGTKAGTVPIKSFAYGFLGTPITAGKSIYFTSENAAITASLWKTDGTSRGTRQIFSTPQYITTPVVFGDRFYFAGDKKLYRSDGTSAGTTEVSIPLGQFTDSQPGRLYGSGATRFFQADDGEAHGFGIWKTDGTQAGTRYVAPRLDVGAFQPVAHGGGLYALANGTPGSAHPPGLYKITTSGTSLVKEVPNFSSYVQLISAGGRMYFTTPVATNTFDVDGAHQLWTSDGTAGGTVAVAGINFINRDISGPFALGGRVYFPVTRKGTLSLWTSDGTPAGTVRVRDIGPKQLVRPGISVGSTGYFSVYYDLAHRALWRTDGTAAGTVMVRDGVVMNESARLGTSSTILFGDNDGLWRTDGTAAGTVRVLEFGALPTQLVTVGNRVVFTIAAKRKGRELWVTDGTAAGTTLLKDIRAGAIGSDPANLTVFKGRVYFSADDGVRGRELWQSDGTVAGTRLTRDIYPGPTSAEPENFSVFGDRLIFRATSDTVGRELFFLDES